MTSMDPPHTILPVLETGEVLKTSPIKGSKGLTSDGSHGDWCRVASERSD
jgi:hypothetical protein